MIFIDRAGAHAPRALLVDGKAHLDNTIRPRAQAGTLRSSDFRRDIYGSEDVRARLWKMQHHKCCFCEREYEKGYSPVEHFRPKTEASDDTKNRGTKRPGYWWLGYAFENLYFCCQNCNTPKSSYFPLASGSAPLVPEQLPADGSEQPLIIDPGKEDPEPHIAWIWSGRRRGYVPVPASGSIRGEKTIYAVDLDLRDDLCVLRAKYYREHIKPVLERHRAAKRAKDDPGLAQALEDAQRLSQPSAQYAGMARYLFRHKGLLPSKS